MHGLLKRKNICKENKSKKNKYALFMIARCGSYWMYLEGDSPYQTVMIVCELK